MKILAVQLANGYSSEAKVLASMLGGRDLARDDALVIRQESRDAHSGQEQFIRDAQARVVDVDTGWRPGWGRSLTGKVMSRVRLLLTLPTVRRLALEYQPDVVVSSQQRWDSHVATSLAGRTGKPQVIHLHYNIGRWLGARVLHRLRSVDHIVTVSDFVRDQVLRFGVCPQHVTTIRNTMRVFPVRQVGSREAVLTELGVPGDAIVAGIVARLDEGKGHPETIRAFATIAADHPNAHLIIAGDGEIRNSLVAQARQTAYAERMHFLGVRSDVPRILGALDVFVHPSHGDPCPLAVLEAAAAGLPILAFAEGGTVELVVNGETGLLAAPGDERELADYLRRLMDNPELARTMGNAGRSRIENLFKPEVGARSFMQLLHAVAGVP